MAKKPYVPNTVDAVRKRVSIREKSDLSSAARGFLNPTPATTAAGKSVRVRPSARRPIDYLRPGNRLAEMKTRPFSEIRTVAELFALPLLSRNDAVADGERGRLDRCRRRPADAPTNR